MKVVLYLHIKVGTAETEEQVGQNKATQFVCIPFKQFWRWNMYFEWKTFKSDVLFARTY
jgi:hypothetical protein